jgi:hypothetical protein
MDSSFVSVLSQDFYLFLEQLKTIFRSSVKKFQILKNLSMI